MRRVVSLALLTAFAFGVIAVRGAAQNLGTVSVQVAPLGRLIPKDFSGFSIEVRAAARAYLGPPDRPNRVFFQLLKNLGAGSIRIGGDSQDLSCWNPQQAPQPQRCRFTITPADIQGFAQASAATGWPVIVGINLAENSASWALPYGVAVEKAFAGTPGSRLAGFEIGNEPDIYYRHFAHPQPARPGHAFHYSQPRTASWNWQELASEWRSYAAAFEGDPATKNVPLIGPAICCAKNFLDTLGPFIDAVGPATFGLVTVHNYPTSTCGGRTVTTEQLLSRATLDRWEKSGSSLAAAVEQRGLPLRMEETNSASCSGQRGVSNTFAATAWGLDWMFDNAGLGLTGVNFHMDVHSPYDAIAVETQASLDGSASYTDSVRPLYYAVYTFAKLAEGRSLLAVTPATSANIAAYAVRASSSAPVRVFLINKDMSAGGSVSIHLSKPMGQATVLRVSALNFGSTEVSYGGVEFDNTTGRLTGVPQQTVVNPDSQGNYAVELPNVAIAMVTIHAK